MEDIKRLNRTLEPLDDELTSEFEKPKLPVSFILEAGRCGSTLVLQLLFNSLRVGHISNLLAKYWLAPYLGAKMEKQVLVTDQPSNMMSKFGMTFDPHEPNEFGWFWRRWLSLADNSYYCNDARNIDRKGLCQKLAAIESVKESPLIFDNVYVAANFPIVKEFLPMALAINLRRDPYFVCNSHINARIKRYGSIDHYYGNRPRNIDALLTISDPVEQTVAQVKSVMEEQRESLAFVADEDQLLIDYESMVDHPRSVVDAFANWLSNHGVQVEERDNPVPERFAVRNGPEFVRPEIKDRLDDAFRRHFIDTPVASEKVSSASPIGLTP